MAKAQLWETDILKLLFNATAVALVADNTATTPLTNLFVSLHTADPTETGNQSSNEANYTGYARVAVARTAGGWTVTTGVPSSVSPVAAITFGLCTAGANTISFFGLGSVVSGATRLFYSGTVTPNIVVSNGVTPQLTTASTITED